MLGNTGAADCFALQTMSIFVRGAAGAVGIKVVACGGPLLRAVCWLADESYSSALLSAESGGRRLAAHRVIAHYILNVSDTQDAPCTILP